MVAEHKIVIRFDDRDRIALMVHIRRWDIRFLERLAIHVDAAIANAHRFSRQPHHSFNIRFCWIQWIPEHHDVSALYGLKAIQKFINEDSFMIGKTRHHACAFHLHGLIKEDDHDEGKEKGKNQVSKPIASFKKPTSQSGGMSLR